MIKGKQRNKLNNFELEIELLLGNHHEKTGYIYYFELLHETFTRATKHLISDSQQFKTDLIGENKENCQSLIQSNESVSNPLIQTLYNSYFITVHSELEIMLIKLNEIVFKHCKNSTFPKKTNKVSFDSFNDSTNTLPFIQESLRKYEILIIYSYVRNGLIHPKNCKGSLEFLELEQNIKEGKISHLEIVDNENRFNFLIKDIDFIVKYSEEIISFLQYLIDNSFKYRTLSHEVCKLKS